MSQEETEGRALKVAVFHNLPSGGGKRRLHELVKRLGTRHKIHLYNLATDCEGYLDLRPLAERTFTSNVHTKLTGGRKLSFLNPVLKLAQIEELDLIGRRMARRIDSGDYDVVFANSCMFVQTPAILRYLRKPVVYHCDEPLRRFYEPRVQRPYNHGFKASAKGVLYGPSDCILKRMERAHIASATTVLVNSCYSREVMYRIFGRFPRVLYLGVDAEVFRRVCEREEGLVVSVGRVAPHKAYDFLIRSVAAIEPKPRLVIACDAAEARERKYLQELAGSLSVELEIRERMGEDELVELYSRATVTALTAILEPFGLSALESMACETPVVAVREGGFRESVVHGETGLLTERTAGAFSASLEKLLKDAALAEEMGRKGREYVKERWSWDASARALESILTEVASVSDAG
jgi:glycosyltransferase involved in cell wall biosynthesis